MASLFKRKNSSFWWIKFKNEKGEWKNKSTGLRWEVPSETRSAKIVLAEVELANSKLRPGNNRHDQWSWVDAFIIHHCQNPLTLIEFQNTWHWIKTFLDIQGIDSPSQVTAQFGFDWIEWRMQYQKKNAKKKHVGRNTAIKNLKLFGVIMQNAVIRGLIPHNPIRGLGIKRQPAKTKPSLTDAEVQKCLNHLENDSEPEWMRRAFLISLHTGCRLRETIIPMECINFEAGTITFPTPKGGKSRAFTRPLPDALKPLFLEIRNRGETVTLQQPFQPSRAWGQFFHRVNLSHLCFHCLRVTYVTRLAQAGVPLWAAMRLVNHSSELIHRTYQRLRVDDVMPFADSVKFPSAIP